MSVERSFEAWEEVTRHGRDLADQLAQGFTGLITNPPAFQWPNPPKPNIFDLDFPVKPDFNRRDFSVLADTSGINGVSAILDIGNRIGQVGADLGACLNGVVHQFFRSLPAPFKSEENVVMGGLRMDGKIEEAGLGVEREFGLVSERMREFGFVESGGSGGENSEGVVVEEVGGFNLKSIGKQQGTVNITSTYDSRTDTIDSALVARGDLWRVEASHNSHNSSTPGNDSSSLFLVQLGPVLFVRDSTLLLPVHLSKQHLLWYGYDRKNGMHSLCPAVWSKHRQWLLMSMLCLNPLACSFVDLQFPNGQFTYVAGEGLTTSAFLPLCGGLLQAQGQYPGEMRFSFSRKNKWGTRITPMIQWPDKSFSVGITQALVWRRTGLMMRPTVQVSLCPTVGGSNPGLRAELIHSVNEQLNLICGSSFTQYPSVFASVSVGRSKWNGNVGRSGIVVRVDTPISRVGRPSFSVQLNSGVEF